MKIIVPLAGPDFEFENGTVKSEQEVDGVPILRRTLERRSWWPHGATSGSDTIFVLRDTAASRAFAQRSLKCWYPAAQLVWLSGPTRGAALSALAGIACVSDPNEPICVDLCDIIYEESARPLLMFLERPTLGGIALGFNSDLPSYSYFRCNEVGQVVEAAEKRVIGDTASAGTYWFRSSIVYCAALAHNLRNDKTVTVNNLFYVCPLYNGVIAELLEVDIVKVRDVRDPKVIL